MVLCCGFFGNPGGEDEIDHDALVGVGEVDLGGVVGVGEGGGDRAGDDAGVPEGEREHVLGAPDEVQTDSLSSSDPVTQWRVSLFSSLTPATESTSRCLERSRITLAL